MKVVFLTDIYNHHQADFAKAMYSSLGADFSYITTDFISEERKKLGWKVDNLPDYVLESKVSSENQKRALQIVKEADVVITGSAPDWMIKDRLKNNQLVVRYSERIYKSGYSWYMWPYRLIKNYFRYGRYKNYYLLCSSAYTSADFAITGNYLKKAYKWGYFPHVYRYTNITDLMDKKMNNSILWVARYIDWKHPELVVKLAQRLLADGYSPDITMIGAGKLESQIRDLVKREGISDYVNVLSGMPTEKVREYMEKSGIFLFTSDFNEGWGAVLNEAMNSGCAVVASHAIGAVPYLIENNINGLIFRNENLDQLTEKVEILLSNCKYQRKLGLNAYKSISETWNADLAVERLLLWCKDIIQYGECSQFENGPCSKAEIIKNGWYIA